MKARYYRSGVKRGGARIVPTKKFFTLIAAVAAIIVVIVLLVTLIPASEQDKTIKDIAQGETETVPATEDDTVKSQIQETQPEEPTPELVVPEEEQPAEPQIPEEPTTPEPTPDPSSYEVLQEGDSGQAVYKLQDRLIELGYLESGNSTGSFGPMTAEAVTKFQKNNNLEDDGIAGGQTQAVLFSDSAVAA